MVKKTKTLPGPCKDVVEGPSEHGGCYTVTYYFDSRYKPVSKERATRSIVHEYDEKERSVFRDYFTCVRGEALPHDRADKAKPAKNDSETQEQEKLEADLVEG